MEEEDYEEYGMYLLTLAMLRLLSSKAQEHKQL